MSASDRATIHLRIITPRHLLAEADAESIALPTLEGEIGVWPGHRPLFVAIGKGRVSFRNGSEEGSFAVRGGYAHIQPEKVLVMTDVDEDDEGVGNAPA
jgi:F-type H+-transporting ATPase subunit epsilon